MTHGRSRELARCRIRPMRIGKMRAANHHEVEVVHFQRNDLRVLAYRCPTPMQREVALRGVCIRQWARGNTRRPRNLSCRCGEAYANAQHVSRPARLKFFASSMDSERVSSSRPSYSTDAPERAVSGRCSGHTLPHRRQSFQQETAAVIEAATIDVVPLIRVHREKALAEDSRLCKVQFQAIRSRHPAHVSRPLPKSSRTRAMS